MKWEGIDNPKKKGGNRLKHKRGGKSMLREKIESREEKREKEKITKTARTPTPGLSFTTQIA